MPLVSERVPRTCKKNPIAHTNMTAEESVNAFDAIFGSNETSRSLASIISLVQKELLQDPRFEAAGKSKVASWTALTKALTAFACLQNVSVSIAMHFFFHLADSIWRSVQATWARQLPNLGLKVLVQNVTVNFTVNMAQLIVYPQPLRLYCDLRATGTAWVYSTRRCTP